MVQSSQWLAIPPVVPVHLTDLQAHDLALELKILGTPVLTCRRLSNQPHPNRGRGGRSPLGHIGSAILGEWQDGHEDIANLLDLHRAAVAAIADSLRKR